MRLKQPVESGDISKAFRSLKMHLQKAANESFVIRAVKTGVDFMSRIDYKWCLN